MPIVMIGNQCYDYQYEDEKYEDNVDNNVNDNNSNDVKKTVDTRYAEGDDNHHAVWRRHNGRHYECLVLKTLDNL